jgi:signal transduction histidine kinase/CheY-like chemotaxis protein
MNKPAEDWSAKARSELSFLAGGGEMGARMRRLDWTKTPLGPPASWPQSLRTIVRVMLDSRYAMWMLWGSELTFFCNDAYLPTVGIKRDWVLGARSDKVWEEIWLDIGPRIQQVLEDGRATWDEALLLYLERSGFPEETYHTFSYSPVYDDDNRVAGMLCVVTEVTERVIGERRLGVLRDLATRSRGSGTVQEASERLMRVLADHPYDVPFACLYTLDFRQERALLAGHCGGLAPALRPVEIALDASSAPWPIAQAVRCGEAQLMELPEGSHAIHVPFYPERVERAIALPVQGQGSAASIAVLVAGISSRHALDDNYRGFFELAARQLAAALADAQAYEAERGRAEALAEIDRAKTAFFSNVSHEFRTPLTLMLGPIEEVLAAASTPKPIRDQLTLARRNSLRLLRLVNSLLDFSRIEAGRVQASFEPTDLAALTRDLASNFRSAIERAGLRFEVESSGLGEPVYVDPQMWEKIILNLLSNAFKFTFEGSIAVRLRRQQNEAVLEIADSGVGIPEHELPRIFERFHRVEGGAGRTQEGSGIGLALVQELVKLHGGTIHAASKLGAGTTFCVRVPFGAAHLPAGHIKAPRAIGSTATSAEAFVQEALRWTPGNAAETSSKLPALIECPAASLSQRFAHTAGARIVLADDNADMRDYIRELLSLTYSVEAVADGEQALAAVRREQPDLIISDIMMPRIDGLELMKTLRADGQMKDIPIILLSARAGEEAQIEGLEAGADDYLIKPFSARELTARVGAHLALRQARRDAIRAISDSEKRIRELFRQAPGFMCILRGPEHVFEFANDSYRLFVGDRDLIGKPVRQMFPELQGQGYFELLDQIYRTGEPISGSETLLQLRRTPDGPLESHFVDFIFQPIKDASGTVTGIFVEGFDITSRIAAQRDLRRSEALRQLALDASAMGTFTWYPEQDRTEPDARMLELFGLKAGGELTLASALGSLIHPQDRARYADAVSRAADPAGSGQLHEDIRVTRPDDGSQRWLAISGQVFFEGEPPRAVRMIGTAMDISERKRVEEALRLADTQKDEFLAMLAHELRNPLAPISTASALLLRTANRDERTQFAIEIIKRQTGQLTRLVDDLLDVSRITRGRIALQRQPIDLGHVITQAVETIEPQLREKQHKISVTTSSYQPLYVSGDLTRLVQCMVNVLGNAAKYTDPGGEIRVATRSEGSSAVIEVNDTGVGINPELLPRIFDLFVQGDRTLDRAQSGLGIGLSVVKRLLEMHEGEITARSQGIGCGSTFVIRLPRIARPQTAAPDTTPTSSPSRRVLIVDDNTDAADTLAVLLGVLGNETQVAFSGKEALERLQTFAPDVMLLDIGLPEMNGYELARLVRADPRWRNIRLVALTGYGQGADRQRAREAGFDDHLIKPVDMHALQRAFAAQSADTAG